MININNEIPKYRKKKKSSVSKSKEKSNHKHEYVDCLLVEPDGTPHKATYCKICGKIGDVKFSENEKIGTGIYRMLNKEEVLEKYKDVEKIYIGDVLQKYVTLQDENKKR